MYTRADGYIHNICVYVFVCMYVM